MSSSCLNLLAFSTTGRVKLELTWLLILVQLILAYSTCRRVFWHKFIAGLIVSVVNPQPGDSIIDCCAAPGGKTLYMASQMHGQGIFKPRKVVYASSKSYCFLFWCFLAFIMPFQHHIFLAPAHCLKQLPHLISMHFYSLLLHYKPIAVGL